MAEIFNWGRTGESTGPNAAAPPHGWPEGMAPGDVNNSAREMMAVLARAYQVVAGTVQSTGTGQAYQVNFDQEFTWVAGRHLSWRTHAANLANPTLQINARAPVQMRDWFGRELPANALPTNALIDCVYDGEHVRVHEVHDTHARIDQLLTLGALVDAPVIAWDLAAAPQAHVTLTANRRMGLPTNGVEGQVYVLIVHQDDTGNRQLTFRNEEYDGGLAGHPDIEKRSRRFSIISYMWYRGKMRFAGILKGYE